MNAQSRKGWLRRTHARRAAARTAAQGASSASAAAGPPHLRSNTWLHRAQTRLCVLRYELKATRGQPDRLCHNGVRQGELQAGVKCLLDAAERHMQQAAESQRDCCTKEVIGYAMDDHYQTQLISRAIRNAARNRNISAA